MAKGPAVVIIARHGARLDAADKTWHLTSPAPYDPPLTYGGWTQSKALGLRIASLLHAREPDSPQSEPLNTNADHAGPGLHNGFSDREQRAHRHERKQKIIIHSSPYLRCIQTSTAIAAGISQFHPNSNTHLHPSKQKNGGDAKPTGHRLAPLEISASQTTPGSMNNPIVQESSKHSQPEKILLRIDAFLGEWLSPDYFEDITPPPNSTMMVAGAKADLLRRGDYVEEQPIHNNKGHFPGGWVKSNGNSALQSGKQSAVEEVDSPLSSMGSLAQALHMRERASSSGTNGVRPGHGGTPPLSTAHKVPSYIYDPPIPAYALSPAEPIPRGYVTHARDACLDVDYLWDSMREPQEWGDGGEYGDEWSTMHKRFRKGLAAMTRWYRDNGAVRNYGSRPQSPANETGEDEEEEIVLILVTHGAGCNALLGAISNQPVLMDVGMTSLSMAVRKDDEVRKTTTPPVLSMRRPSVIDTGIPEEYKLKIVASLDHLRPGVDPAKLPELSSPLVTAKPSLDSRRRFSPVEYPFPSVDPFRGANSSLGSIRRPSTSGTSSRLLSSHTRSNTATPPMPGLWSRAPNNSISRSGSGDSQEQEFGLNFGDSKPKISSTGTDKTLVEKDNVAPLPTTANRPSSQHGLWGPPPNTEQNERRPGPKRRWTVTETE
jgi:hypothetical protein